jgi:hypothetical protein
MRKKLMASDSNKGVTARHQRAIFKTVKGLRLEYLM